MNWKKLAEKAKVILSGDTPTDAEMTQINSNIDAVNAANTQLTADFSAEQIAHQATKDLLAKSGTDLTAAKAELETAKADLKDANAKIKTFEETAGSRGAAANEAAKPLITVTQEIFKNDTYTASLATTVVGAIAFNDEPVGE